MIAGLIIAASPTLSVMADDDDHTETSDDHTDDHSDEETTETEHETETQDDGTDEKFKEKSDAFEREYRLEKENNEFKLESEAKAGTQKDKIKIEFKAGGNDELEFDLKYSTEIGDNETELRFRVKIDKLVEFVENGTEPGFQPGEEIQEVRLGDIGWKDLVYTTENQVEVITAETMDGVFKLIIRYSPTLINERNFTLTPNSIKFDVLISNFDFQANNSQLAVETKLKTVAKLEYKVQSFEEEQGFSEQEQEMALDAGEYKGYFSWAEIAIADGNTVAVIPSETFDASDEEDDLDVGESASKMYFAFNATTPSEIVWDPKIGVVSVSALEALSQLTDAAGLSLPINIWVIFLTIGSVAMISRKLRQIQTKF